MSTPKPLIFTPSIDILKLQGSFLDIKSLHELSRTCKQFRDLHQKPLKSVELLDCVVNINEVKKQRIIAILSSLSLEARAIILEPTIHYITVEARALKQGRTRFNHTSPLQAAAICGDLFSVNRFLQALPPQLNPQAKAQLQEVRDHREFLSFLADLDRAYQVYIDHYQALKDANIDSYEKLKAANQLDTIKTNFEQIGEKQKMVSNFVLQLFCRRISFAHQKPCTLEPARDIYIDGYDPKWDALRVTLHNVGTGTYSALIKGWLNETHNVANNTGFFSEVKLDREAFACYAKQITQALDATITRLKDAPKDASKSSKVTSPSKRSRTS